MTLLSATRTLSFLLLAALAAGCDSSSLEIERTEIRPGVISAEGYGSAQVEIAGVTVSQEDARAFEISDTPPVVQAGVPFDVTVYTFSSYPPCEEIAPSRLDIEGSTATVAVFKEIAFFSDPNSACLAILIFQPRTEQVVFAEPGPAVVVVEGIRSLSGVPVGESHEIPHTLRFDVIVE